jgi:Uma2 family endonuclease
MKTTEDVVLSLTPRDAGITLSAAEFAGADFQEPYRYERVKGRLVVMTPAGPKHRRVSRPFRRELGAYWASHRDCVEDVDVEGWVVTSPNDDRIPDICVYLLGSSPAKMVPQRVPDLIFEFVSEDRADQERDYIFKRSEYHAIGVREFVIVDRFKRSVLVLTWREGDFGERTPGAGEAYTTPLLPGLRVDLSEVFGADW